MFVLAMTTPMTLTRLNNAVCAARAWSAFNMNHVVTIPHAIKGIGTKVVFMPVFFAIGCSNLRNAVVS